MKTGKYIGPLYYREGIVVPEFVEDHLLYRVRNSSYINLEELPFQFDLWRFVARYKRMMGIYP